MNKTPTDITGLALRYPYITNPLLAFLLIHGMNVKRISEATGIHRRTLLKYQLSGRLNKKHTRALASAVRRILTHAKEAKKFGNTKQHHLYHDHLDTMIAWGEYIIKQERSKFDDA